MNSNDLNIELMNEVLKLLQTVIYKTTKGFDATNLVTTTMIETLEYFNIKEFSVDDIYKILEKIAEKENINITFNSKNNSQDK